MNSKDLYLRLLRYVRPYWRIFVLSIVGTVVLAATEPAMPALLKPMLDGSFVEKDQDMIRLIPLVLIGLFAIRGIAGYVSTVAITWVANRLVMDLREEMFQKLISLPTHYYDDHSRGNLISKVTYDVTQVTSAATNTLIVLIKDSLTIIGLLAWMFYINWQLSMVAFLVVPFIAFIVRKISGRLRHLNRSLQQSMGDMTHVLDEAVNGHKVIKLFGGQEYEKKRFYTVSNWLRRYYMKLAMASAANVPIVQLIAAVALAIIVYIAALQSAAGQITVGGFVSFFGAMAMLFSPLKKLTSINEHLQRGLAAAESVFKLIDEPPEQDTGSQPLTRAQGKIEFRTVTLRYPSSEKPALDQLTFTVQPGETLALVGPSGSGKSSIANLIPRFYSATSGQILIDDMPIETLKLDDLRSNISFVSQDVILFNDTVAANIAYGTLAGTDEEKIIAAANAAYALEFIQAMPQGLATVIGENGLRLSGGQRQRLAIARALLKNAPILILDEATSALDAQSEHYIKAALDNLKKGRTTIIIAHRLSTVENANRIIVLDKGHIVETGTHQQLLADNGLYAKLYRSQGEMHVHFNI